MQIIGNLFTIVIFISMAGSLFALFTLFLKKILHTAVPLWFGILGAVFFLVPFTVPQVRLVPGEEQVWLEGFLVACRIWSLGALLLSLYYIVRGMFTGLAVQRLPACGDGRVNQIYQESGEAVGLKRLPSLRFGTQADPACVAALLRPVILLNQEIAGGLPDRELRIILVHELTHVKRLHHVWQRLYDLVCCVNWLNLLAWIAKNDFALSCEMDCDSRSIRVLEGEDPIHDYVAAMIHLLEISRRKGSVRCSGISALSFLETKQRFLQVYHRPSGRKRACMAAVFLLCIALTLIAAGKASRTYFPPYPGLDRGEEYSGLSCK